MSQEFVKNDGSLNKLSQQTRTCCDLRLRYDDDDDDSRSSVFHISCSAALPNLVASMGWQI